MMPCKNCGKTVVSAHINHHIDKEGLQTDYLYYVCGSCGMRYSAEEIEEEEQVNTDLEKFSKDQIVVGILSTLIFSFRSERSVIKRRKFLSVCFRRLLRKSLETE